jgi:hypothetical protein
VNTNGGHVVVVKSASARAFTVGGLPAATYGIRYTTAGADFQAAPDVTLAAGQPLSANIPGAGVITIYRK